MASLSDMTMTVELTDKAQTQLDYVVAQILEMRSMLSETRDELRYERDTLRAERDALRAQLAAVPVVSIETVALYALRDSAPDYVAHAAKIIAGWISDAQFAQFAATEPPPPQP